MRSGNLFSRVNFYAKVTTRDAFGASADTWPSITISTRGELRWVGGSKSLSNEEQFYSKNMELTVRYRSSVVETMRVQIDGTNDLYAITYIEIIGRKEGLRLTLEKLSDGLNATLVQPPTAFSATLDSEVKIDLAWTNNADKDGVIIERSTNGNDFTVIVQIPKLIPEVTTYSDEDLDEFTRYYYRARAFKYYNYSAYTAVDDAITEAVVVGSENSWDGTYILTSGAIWYKRVVDSSEGTFKLYYSADYGFSYEELMNLDLTEESVIIDLDHEYVHSIAGTSYQVATTGGEILYST